MTPERVSQNRAYIVWLCRLLVFVFLGVAIYEFIEQVAYGVPIALRGGEFWGFAFGYSGGGVGANVLHRIIANVLVAIILMISARPLSRWIVTMPANVCPGCGYPRPGTGGKGEMSNYCSECGLQGFEVKQTVAEVGAGDAGVETPNAE